MIAYHPASLTLCGSPSETGGVPITIRYGVSVDSSLTDPTVLVNTALINDGRGNVLSRQALAIANGLATYLPVIQKN